jgi:putative regulatory protein, FmdB family
MPTYEYVCKSCGHLFEVVQSMRDDALTQCPECGGELRKVFAPPAISFKGSGFYATDHGKKRKSSSSDKKSSSSETSTEKSSDDKKPSGDKHAESTSKGEGSSSPAKPSGSSSGSKSKES